MVSYEVNTPQFQGYLTFVYSKIYNNVTLLEPPGWKSYKASAGLTRKESDDMKKDALKDCLWRLKLREIGKEKEIRLAELEAAESKRKERKSHSSSRKKTPKEQLGLDLKST